MVWGSASRAQFPLTAGIVMRQFSSLRDTTWRNNGISTRNGSRFDNDTRILSGEYKYSRGEIESVML